MRFTQVSMLSRPLKLHKLTQQLYPIISTHSFSTHTQRIESEFNRQSDALFDFNKTNHDILSQPLITHAMNIENTFENACKILEVGCGPGLISVECAKQLKNTKKIIGIDITKKMIDIANNHKENNNIDHDLLQFMQCNVENLPFETNDFDVVITRWTFHHFDKLNQCLTEIHRVLNNNGGTLLFMEVKAPDTNINDEKLYNAVAKLRDPTHICAYNKKGWIEQLKKAGFDENKIDIKEEYFGVERCFMDWIKQTKVVEREPLYDICKELYNKHIDFGMNLRVNEDNKLTMRHSYIIIQAQK